MLRPPVFTWEQRSVSRARAKRLSSFPIRHSTCHFGVWDGFRKMSMIYVVPSLRFASPRHASPLYVNISPSSRGYRRGARGISSVKERITLIWQIARRHDFERARVELLPRILLIIAGELVPGGYSPAQGTRVRSRAIIDERSMRNDTWKHAIAIFFALRLLLAVVYEMNETRTERRATLKRR